MNIPDRILRRGYRQAAQITRRFAKTFYFASHLLPLQKKQAAYAVYALCRLSDDAVDHETDPKKAQQRLNNIQEKIDTAYAQKSTSDPLICAFRDAVKNTQIPRKYFDELLLGLKMDLSKKTFETFEDLDLYCYRVAGVVGLIMAKILKTSSPDAETCAVNLGKAMQLTNILRDICEDFEKGRVYLPLDELKRFNVRSEDLQLRKTSPQLTALLRFQIERARKFYEESEPGIQSIPGRREKIVVATMKKLYSMILEKIEKNGYNIFKKRATTTLLEKITQTFDILLKECLS